MPCKTVSFPETLQESPGGPQRLPEASAQSPGTSESKEVFVRSGIRFDYLMYDKDRTFLRELCEYHVSGQLKVAPEHISDPVLEKMGKPPVSVYNRFVSAYKDMNEKLGKKQYLVPYLMSSHPDPH